MFLNNAAVVHSSNGGAISLECDFVEVINQEAASQVEGSSLEKSQSFFTNGRGYKGLKYGTKIVQNTF